MSSQPAGFRCFSILLAAQSDPASCLSAPSATRGASPSFASYMVHEPNPIAGDAQHLPAFYYAVWFMLILAGGVFVFFLPYTVLWWLRT